ncbi:hypothetical protein KA977_11140 [Candidatus Dependentiae bacterium]|nr:hypothetical protein [Candidatus Dependentiae bacterium]
MKLFNKLLTYIKFILFLLLIIYCFSTASEADNPVFAFISLISIVLLTIDFLINSVKTKEKRKFIINTEFGAITISENVIENIISVILRKYKIIKHYICTVYNKNDLLVINLNVEITMNKNDMLPIILETLKNNIKESIDETIGVVKTEDVEINVEKIKRLRDIR